MVRIELVELKIARLRRTLADLRRVLPGGSDELGDDADVRDLVAFRVYLALQEVVDLAAHVISDEGWGPVASLREHFDVLAARGVIGSALATELSLAMRVRNLIGHNYVEIDPVRLHAAASRLSEVTDDFCAALLTHATKHGRGV